MVYDGGPERARGRATRRPSCSCTRTRSTPWRSRASARSSRRWSARLPALFHAPTSAAGFMTSGGTESILMAVKAARERARDRARRHRAEHGDRSQRARGVPQGRALLRCPRAQGRPSTPTGGPTSTRWRRSSTTNTVLVVGSAPQYPQGVIDPIPELAALAAIGRRVDARRRVHGRLRAAVHGDERRSSCRRGTSASTASRRSRPTSTSSATRPRARR